jgi:hypothetical protein
MSPSSSPWKGSSPPHWVSAGGRVRWSERNSRKKGCRHTNLSLRKEELSVLAETRGQHPEKRLWLGTLWQDWGCWSGDKCLLGHKDPWVVQWRDQIPVISSCTTNNLKSQHLENCLSHFLTGLNCSCHLGFCFPAGDTWRFGCVRHHWRITQWWLRIRCLWSFSSSWWGDLHEGPVCGSVPYGMKLREPYVV